MSLDKDTLNKIIPGYHLDPKGLPSTFTLTYYITDQNTLPFNNSTISYDVNFNFIPDKQHSEIDYQYNGQNVYITKLNGKTDEQIDLSKIIKAPQGYNLVPNQNIPNNYLFKDDNNIPIIIQVVPNGKEVKATVQFIDEDNNEAIVGQPIKISGTLNSVYTINNNQIPKHYKLAKNQSANVTLNSNHTILVKVIHQHSQKRINQITRTVIHHWVYGDGPKAGQKAAKDSVLEIYYCNMQDYDEVTGATHLIDSPDIAHDTLWIDTTRGDASTPGVRIVSGKWNVQELHAKELKDPIITSGPSQLNKDVLVAIAPNIEGYTIDTNANLRSSGNMNTDYVSPWTTFQNWRDEAFTPQWNNSGSEKSGVDTSKFYRNIYHILIEYKDGNKIIAKDNNTITGYANTAINNLKYQVPKNYVIAEGQSLLANYIIQANNNLPIVIQLKHDTKEVSRPYEAKRDIYIQLGNHAPFQYNEQGIILHQTGQKDLVTNNIQ